MNRGRSKFRNWKRVPPNNDRLLRWWLVRRGRQWVPERMTFTQSVNVKKIRGVKGPFDSQPALSRRAKRIRAAESIPAERLTDELATALNHVGLCTNDVQCDQCRDAFNLLARYKAMKGKQ